MRRASFLVIGTAVVALGTVLLGWLAPAAWGAVAGLLRAGKRPAREAALASAMAWAALLLGQAFAGHAIGTLASRLGGALGIPSPVLVLVTLLFPAVLAGCAAAVVEALVPMRRGPSGVRDPGAIARRAA
jgi:hypothetical protein